MQRSILLWALIVLSFIGLADAWYLTQSAFDGAALACNITGLDGCNAVAKSPYSHVLGLPLALYGFVFYAFLFALGALLLVVAVRIAYQAAVVLSILGVLASLYFLYLQLFVIRALCIYCLGSLIIATLICGVTLWLWKRYTPPRLVVVG